MVIFHFSLWYALKYDCALEFIGLTLSGSWIPHTSKHYSQIRYNRHVGLHQQLMYCRTIDWCIIKTVFQTTNTLNYELLCRFVFTY